MSALGKSMSRVERKKVPHPCQHCNEHANAVARSERQGSERAEVVELHGGSSGLAIRARGATNGETRMSIVARHTQGERTVKAKDVMTTLVVAVGLDTPVVDVARCLLRRRISAVPVVDTEGGLAGTVSEGDFVRRPESGGEPHPSWWLALFADPEKRAQEYVKIHGGQARDVMTRSVSTATEEASLEEIATLLEKYRIKSVPVVRDGKLVGIVSRSNLMQGIIARQSAPQPSVDDLTLRKRITAEKRASGARSECVDPVAAAGVVYLWGVTYSEAEREAIGMAVAGVDGVKRVEGQLGILSPMVVAHMWA